MRIKGKKSETIEVQVDAIEFLTELKTRVDVTSGVMFMGHFLAGDGIWCKPNGETVRVATKEEITYHNAWSLIFDETKKAKEKKLV